MCSTPPARTTSHAPIAISPAPAVTAVSAPAHMRSSAKPGTDCGIPARSATSRPSVRPWSPTCAVAAKMTSPIRSGGTAGLRRNRSRTTLTAMSSARVFQKIPCGPARPNAVRTPSTNTTSRRSIKATLRCGCGFELFAQVFELPAVGGHRLAAVLQQDRATGVELPVAACVEQPPVRPEAVAWRVDGVLRLGVVARVALGLRQIREVGDDQVDGLGDRVEQVSLQDVHPVGHSDALGVRTREPHRL